MLPTCLTTLSVLHLHLETVTYYSSQLTNSLFFPCPNSRDLPSQRWVYYYGVTYMGLIPISLDAIFITFHDTPFVKGSASFLSVWMCITVITPEFLNYLTHFKCIFTCPDDFALSLELFTLEITVWLSQFKRIASTGFSTIGKSIKSSRNHYASKWMCLKQ